MKKLVFTFFVIIAAVSLSACNTVSGIGKDIEKSGQAIERVAK